MMTENTTTEVVRKDGLTEQEHKDLWQMWRRSCLFNGSMQAIKRQAMGFCYALSPFLDRYYADDEEARRDAYVRHTQYINTGAGTAPFILGLTMALEKEKAEKHTVTGEVITNIKTSLMGPLASINDSIFQVTLRVLAAGIAISFAEQGSPLGALIFVAIFGLVWFGIKMPLLKAGYTMGTKFLSDLFDKGLIDSIIKATSVMGLTMIGALTSSLMTTTLALEVTFGETVVSFQTLVDGILTNGLSLAMLFFVYWMYKKKHMSVVQIVLVIICMGIVFSFFGIM